MLAIAILAQTFTAVPTSASFAELKDQFTQMLVAGAIALAGMLFATIKGWLRARLAEKLTKVTVTGVENSSRAIEAALVGHLGDRGMKALASVGIDLDQLRDKLVTATKKSIQAVSISEGTEEKLAPIVAKVTSERPAVDGDGNPVVK